MKILKSSVLLLLAVIALGVTSCKEKATGLQSMVPADADVVASLDLSRALENAGCTAGADGITLSPSVKSLLEASGADDEALGKLCNMRGIDFENIYVVAFDVYGNNAQTVCLTNVTDMNALTESLSNLDLENEMIDDYMVYKGECSVIIRDNIAWLSNGNPSKAIEKIEKVKSMAETKSAASVGWISSYLAADRCTNLLLNFANMPDNLKKQLTSQATMGASTLAKLMDGRLAFTLDFQGLEATMNVYGTDENGKTLGLTDDLGDIKPIKITPDFLPYLTADDVIVGAVAIPENYPWKEMLSAMAQAGGIPAAQLQMALPYLEDIQGTVAVAAGPTKGMASFNSRELDWDIMLFITLKPGKAEEYFAQLSELASMAGKVEINKADKSLSVDVMGAVKAHMAVRDNMLVVATHAIEKSDAGIFSKSDFAGQYSTLIAKLNKTNPLAKDLNLPFGVFSKMFTEENVGVWNTELTECSGKFLSNILDYCVAMNK